MTAPVFVAGKVTTAAFTDTVTLSSVDGGAAANRCILALLWAYGDASGTITGATCNGVAMTSVVGVANSSTGNYKYQMFYIVSDSTITTGTTNTIVASFGGGVVTHGQVFAGSYSGVSAVSGGKAASANNQTPKVMGVTSAVGDLVVALFMENSGAGHTWTATSPASIDYNSTAGGFGSFAYVAFETAGSGTPPDIGGTISGSGDGWLAVATSLAAVGGGGFTPKQRRTLGPRVGSRQGGFVRLGSGVIAPRRFASNDASYLEAA